MMAKFSSQSTQSRTREEVEKIKWSEPTPLCFDFFFIHVFILQFTDQ